MKQQPSLDELIGECASARSSAEHAIARSADLLDRLADTQRRVAAARLASRRRTHYARIEGMVGNAPVTGVIRRDGTVSGEPRLLDRVDLVVKLGDSFDSGRLPASKGCDPLASTLTVARACDRVLAVAVYGASSRSETPGVVAVASIGRAYPDDAALPGGDVCGRGPGGARYPLDRAPLFRVSLASSDGAQVVRLSGELDLAYRDELEAALASAVSGGTDVVVDASHLMFIDAASLSALVAARERATSSGRRLVVRGAQGIVRRVFGVCQLDHLLGD